MLDALHTAIIDRLKADLPSVFIEAYPDLKRTVTLPAVLIDLEELEPDDFGEEPLDCWARFTAYCIYSPNATKADQQIRNLAAEVAVRVSQEADFGIEIHKPVQVLRIAPDSFKDELEGYLVWAVEFQVGISIGEDVWSIDPADGVSVVEIELNDFNGADLDHVMADGDEPAAQDSIELPAQPKG